MEIDLSPKLAKKVYGEDGAYYVWYPNELPMLSHSNIGAAKLVLENNGFALPRYSDSAKVAYVLQAARICRQEMKLSALRLSSMNNRQALVDKQQLPGSNRQPLTIATFNDAKTFPPSPSKVCVNLFT